MTFRRLAGLIVAAVAAPGLLVLATDAQARQSAKEACRAMTSDADRIACLEDALDAATGASVPEAAVAPEPAIEPAQRDGFRLTVPFVGGRRDAPEPPVSPAAGTAAATAAETEVGTIASFGAEQIAPPVAQQREAPRSLTAAIAALRTDLRGRLLIELDNGQLWRQTELEEFPVEVDMNRAQPVEIVASRFGGYRMQLLAIDRRIKVERVQ